MKKGIIALSLLFVCSTVAGQSIIFSKDLFDYLEQLKKHEEIKTQWTMQWTINGITFTPSADSVTIYPHEKGFDTIFFQQTINSKTTYDTIFSRIPNKQELIMVLNECCSGFDILKKEYFTQVEEGEYHDSLYDGPWQDIGAVKFVILNKPITDTLICAYVGGGINVGQMITVDKDYGWLFPLRTIYTMYVFPISIMKLNTNIKYELYEDDEWFKGIDIVTWDASDEEATDCNILKQFKFRLFYNEKVIIQYDYLTNEIKLHVDEN